MINRKNKKPFKPGQNPPRSTDGMIVGRHQLHSMTRETFVKQAGSLEDGGVGNPFDRIALLAGHAVVDPADGALVPDGYTKEDVAQQIGIARGFIKEAGGKNNGAVSGKLDPSEEVQYKHCFRLRVIPEISRKQLSAFGTDIHARRAEKPKVIVADSTLLEFEEDEGVIASTWFLVFSLKEPIEGHQEALKNWLYGLVEKHGIQLLEIERHDSHVQYDEATLHYPSVGSSLNF